MQLWTTFAPRKVSWEVTKAKTQGNHATSDWLSKCEIIESALASCKQIGIKGVRLVIYPQEITDGKTFSWDAVDSAIALCHKHSLQIDFCLGPFQYPYYPGVYIPEKLLIHLDTPLDTNPTMKAFGLQLLREQLVRFGNDERIRGFYLGNEWHDFQNVSQKESVKTRSTESFMLEAISIGKSLTRKPLLFNTNIDPMFSPSIIKHFGAMLAMLGKQGKLGFDIYPTQEIWKKVPHVKLRRLIQPFHKALRTLREHLPETEMFFAEVEAQPWGNGKSWYQLISKAPNPSELVLNYDQNSLERTMTKYIIPTGITEVSLWGVEFWLVAQEMGIMWPIDAVENGR